MSKLVTFLSIFFFFTSFIVFIECGRPNFVIFLTDDQDLLLDGMVPMEKTIKNIGNQGVTFSEAYVHSPICCPSRSSLLTGKYLHNLNVYNNSENGNCAGFEWQTTHEKQSIAAYLKVENYVNFYAGKYLNQYGSKQEDLSHIPPGFDWWYGLKGNSKYYNFTLSVNGSKVDYHQEYLTDLMGQFAHDFLDNKPPSSEFMMILATPAAHAPFTPAVRHSRAFPDTKTKVTPSFNVSADDKHWLLQLPPHHLPSSASTILDDIQRKRMQTLLSVDELVDSVIHKLDTMNILNNTYIFFTSDNGFHIGQFGLPWDKRQPYQTDIHIPLLIRGPHIPKKRLISHPISLVDLAPTILGLANITVPEAMDGYSFVELLQEKPWKSSENVKFSQKIREQIFIEYFGEGNANSVQKECNFSIEDSENLSECSVENWCKCQDARNNTFSCVINFDDNRKFKYCVFKDNLNFTEVYDLNVDPYELINISSDLDVGKHQYYQDLLSKYGKCKGITCRSIKL